MKVPDCLCCHMQMRPIPGEQRSWQCEGCEATCRIQSVLQKQSQEISKLDQLLAAETDPVMREAIQKHLELQEESLRAYEELKAKGVKFGPVETWFFPGC